MLLKLPEYQSKMCGKVLALIPRQFCVLEKGEGAPLGEKIGEELGYFSVVECRADIQKVTGSSPCVGLGESFL